jgi:hypothetical protein
LTFTETTDHAADLGSLRTNSAAQTARNDNYADIVILFTSPGAYTVLGAAYLKAKNSYAYGIVDISAGVLTGVHETGHIMGARHQRCTECSASQCDNDSNNHGFRVGTASSTIMRQLPCGGTRISRFSNPSTPFMGMPTGDASNNNSAIIISRAGKVACFRPQPPAPTEISNVDISGPSQICTGPGFGYYTVAINGFDGVPPYSYLWEVSSNGISGWTTVGTSSYLALTNAGSLPNPFFLRVTVTDFAGKKGSDVQSVSLIDCFGGGADDRSSIDSEQVSQTNTIYPNPVIDVLEILVTEDYTLVEVLNSNGTLADSSFKCNRISFLIGCLIELNRC